MNIAALIEQEYKAADTQYELDRLIMWSSRANLTNLEYDRLGVAYDDAVRRIATKCNLPIRGLL